MSAYPKNLQYLVRRLSNYSRQTKRLSTLSSNSATNGSAITIDLPSNTLCDLSSFVMSFKASSSGGGLPRNIETLIQNCSVEINGQIISGCSHYGQLMHTILDTSVGQDCINRRRILQNAGDASAADSPSREYAISNWLVFNSLKPSILDTRLLGQVRLRIMLDSGSVLVSASPTSAKSFNLTDISFSVDVINIDDGLFDTSHSAFLAGGGVYEICFKNYFSYSGSSSSYSQSTKFSISTQSLNRAWGTFLQQGSTGELDAQTKTSNTFTRVATGLDTAQFSINGTYYPDYRASVPQAFYLMQSSYNLLQDTLGGCNPLCNSLENWRDKFYAFSMKFCHDDNDFISGINTLGNSSVGSFDTQAVAGAAGTGNLMSLVFLECSSMIRVAAGRQIELVI